MYEIQLKIHEYICEVHVTYVWNTCTCVKYIWKCMCGIHIVYLFWNTTWTATWWKKHCASLKEKNSFWGEFLGPLAFELEHISKVILILTLLEPRDSYKNNSLLHKMELQLGITHTTPKNIFSEYLYPLDTGRKLNVHKTFRRRPRPLLNVLFTFNLRPVPRGYMSLFDKDIIAYFLKFFKINCLNYRFLIFQIDILTLRVTELYLYSYP